MCRFAVYLGEEITLASLLTEPTNSIIHQSFHSHERSEPLNGDGFGLAWYVEGSEEPAVFKEVNPAWNSLNLHNLAQVTRTHCLLAHVRAATPGFPVTQYNCHPFAWEGLSFMHNGSVAGFSKLKRPLRSQLSDGLYNSILGSTDSEHVFALIVEAWKASTKTPALERLADAMCEGIGRVEELMARHQIDEPSLLNLVLCDGKRAVVSRFSSDRRRLANSLYVHSGDRYVCEGGTCRMTGSSGSRGAVIVSSEPLSEDSGWQRVPENHLVLVGAALEIQFREICTD